MDTPEKITNDIASTKQLRKELDATLQNLRKAELDRRSRERSLALTKIQEAIMWLGMDLKAINDANPGSQPNPYPSSDDPASPRIEPTADGLKL